MTITFHWWMASGGLLLMAVFAICKRPSGDWDFAPMIYAVGYAVAAVALTIGHFL